MTQSVTVQKGGKIVLVVPSLAEGSKVDIVVRPASSRGKRKFGSAKGKGHVGVDFETPLDEFKDYM